MNHPAATTIYIQWRNEAESADVLPHVTLRQKGAKPKLADAAHYIALLSFSSMSPFSVAARPACNAKNNAGSG